jgi:hypothetical protein
MSPLIAIAQALMAQGNGLLAMDESVGTCNRRLAEFGFAQTQDSCRRYRELFVTAPGLSEAISSAILFDENLHQNTRDGIQVRQERGDDKAGRPDLQHHPRALSNAPDDDFICHLSLLHHLDQRPRVLAQCDGVGIFRRRIYDGRTALDVGQPGLVFGDGKLQGSNGREHVAWPQDALGRDWPAHDAQQSIADRPRHQDIARHLAFELVDHALPHLRCE